MSNGVRHCRMPACRRTDTSVSSSSPTAPCWHGGVAELVSQVAGAEVSIAAVGGGPGDELGTDGARVLEAMRRGSRGAGSVVLMDLGSSVLAVKAALGELAGRRARPHPRRRRAARRGRRRGRCHRLHRRGRGRGATGGRGGEECRQALSSPSSRGCRSASRCTLAPQVRSCAWRPKPSPRSASRRTAAARMPRASSRCSPWARRAGPELEISASGADAVEALERLAELVAGLT